MARKAELIGDKKFYLDAQFGRADSYVRGLLT
jgi:hypothetical protein